MNSPRLLNLPLLLLANKQDSPSSLSVAEIRKSFDAWQRARTNRNQDSNEDDPQEPGEGKAPLKNADGAHETDVPRTEGEGWDDGGAKAERMASLDVMGISALEG